MDASARGVVALWERGRGRANGDLALVVAGALQDGAPADVAAWPLARRDDALLTAYGNLFGEAIDGVVGCGACGAELEIAMTVGELRRHVAVAVVPERVVARSDAYEVVLRVLVAGDLAGLPRDLERAIRTVVRRCAVEVRRAGETIDAGDLPDSVVSAISDALGEADPAGDVVLRVLCAACGEASDVPFDAASFFWERLNQRAAAAFLDVDALARAYGWSEAKILGLSDARRRRYLELALA
jgi:hypothetical protein